MKKFWMREEFSVQWRTFMKRNNKQQQKRFVDEKYYSNIYEQNSSHVLQIIEMLFLSHVEF